MAVQPKCTATPFTIAKSGSGSNNLFNSPGALGMIIIVCFGGGLLLVRWYRESPTKPPSPNIPPGPPVKPGENAFLKLDSSQLQGPHMQPPGPPVKPGGDSSQPLAEYEEIANNDSSQLQGPHMQPGEDGFSKWDYSSGEIPPSDGDLPAVQ